MEGFEAVFGVRRICGGGENLEHACRREAMEETGIKLGEVRYSVRSRGRSRLR